MNFCSTMVAKSEWYHYDLKGHKAQALFFFFMKNKQISSSDKLVLSVFHMESMELNVRKITIYSNYRGTIALYSWL